MPQGVDNEAGWEFNPQYDVETTHYIGGNPITMTRHLTGTEANALTDGQLKTRPFFSGFRDEAILSSSNGIAVASSLDRRASALAYGIPVESFAVGTGRIGRPEGCRNVNMVDFLEREGEAMNVPTGPTWTHSAFIGLPLKDVSGLFKDFNSQMKGRTDE